MRAMWVVAALLVLAGCSGEQTVRRQERDLPERIRVSSPAFRPGGAIPERFGCDGESIAPPLRWTAPPPGTAQLALVVDDPDAPGGTYVHWVVVGLDPAVRGVGDGALPVQARQLLNSAGKRTYTGPCPPDGDQPHHYRFTVYALGRALEGPDTVPLSRALEQIEAAATARGRLVGTFDR